MPLVPAERLRWEHTRLRRRLLYGQWEQDLTQRIQRAIGAVRREAWGVPDLSANPFRAICAQVSVTYDRAPMVCHSDAAAETTMRDLLEGAGWSQLMARIQRDTLGLREMLLRVDLQDGELLLRPVYPDMVQAVADPDRPDMPAAIRELRLRTHEGKQVWAWDVLDVRDPAAPVYQVMLAESSAGGDPDISESVLGVEGGLVGEAYPYRDAKGRPILPYVLYHAHRTGTLWDPWEGAEVVDGTLNVAVMWSFFAHCVRNASWPQRYAIGVEVPQGEQVGGTTTARHEVVADAATILLLARSSDHDGQPMVGQFQPGADPEVLAGAVSAYERRLAAYAGLSASDIQRVSGDPRSGYALAISREGQREAARRIEPQFRRGDLQLLRVVAALYGQALPESGWTIRYESVPPSSDELAQTRDQLTWEAEKKLIGPVEMWRRLHPGASEEQARAALIAAAVEEAQLVADQRTAIDAQGLGKEKTPEPPSAAVMQAVQQIVVGVYGTVPHESGRAMLTTVVGLSDADAHEIIPEVEDTTDERPDDPSAGSGERTNSEPGESSDAAGTTSSEPATV